MSIVTELKIQAEREHAKLDKKRKDAVSELEKIKIRTAELESIILSASGSHKRLLQFNPFVGDEAQCPRCWVVHNIESNLKCDVARRRELDLYECQNQGCKFFIEVPA